MKKRSSNEIITKLSHVPMKPTVPQSYFNDQKSRNINETTIA